MIKTTRVTYGLQASDETEVFEWIYKMDSLYHGYLQSLRGTARSSGSTATVGRARSSTFR